MKRIPRLILFIVTALLCVCMLFGGVASAADAAGPSGTNSIVLTASSASSSAGNKAEIQISANDYSALSEFSFDLKYDLNKLTLEEIQPADFLANADLQTDISKAGTAHFSGKFSSAPTQDTAMFTLHFNVKESAEGNIPLAFGNIQLFGNDGRVLSGEAQTGVLSVTAAQTKSFDIRAVVVLILAAALGIAIIVHTRRKKSIK